MKGAIISNNPYHHNPSANLTNKELADRIDKQLFYDDPNLDDKLGKLDVDFIIAWVNINRLFKIKSLSNICDKIILASGDIPKRLRDRKFKNVCRYHKASGIIVENKCSIPVFKDYLYKGEELNYYWYPWGIDTKFVKDYKEHKIYDVSQLGQFNIYQYRREIYNLLANNTYGIKYFRFWPNRDKLTKKEEISYDTYCKTLNKSRISIGGCLQHSDYTTVNGHFIGINFGKNLEIPGCKCALFNTDWGDKNELGFKDGENFIQFNDANDCLEKIKYYLEDLNELNKIIEKGYKLVQSNHTNKIHVNKLLKNIYESN